MLTDFELIHFQPKTLERCLKEKRHFIFYRMGLGKTVVGVKGLHEVRPDTVLILCPKNAIRVWEDHIKEWFAGLDAKLERNTPYAIHRWRKKQSDQYERRQLWQQRVPGITNIYIMTYNTFIVDDEFIPHNFTVVINDEAKRIRSKDSKAFVRLKRRCKVCEYYWPLTGTPGRLPPDFWTMFHLADPKFYGSYWRFTEAFCHVIKNEWNRMEILGLKNPTEWNRALYSKASIVTKDMVKEHFPTTETTRQLLYVQMTDEQEKLYKEMAEEMMLFDDSGKIIIAKTSLERTLKLRQMLVCPKILSPNFGYGAALEDLIETLQNTVPHVVIFTPFVAAFPWIKQALQEAGYLNIFTLSGGISPDEVAERIAKWRESKGIMICSIMFAQSFSLEPAAEAFFLGYEWNPEDNEQAEERLNRLTTNYPISAYYYCHEGTYEEEHMEILNIKQRQAKQTIDSSKVGLKFGLKDSS